MGKGVSSWLVRTLAEAAPPAASAVARERALCGSRLHRVQNAKLEGFETARAESQSGHTMVPGGGRPIIGLYQLPLAFLSWCRWLPDTFCCGASRGAEGRHRDQ